MPARSRPPPLLMPAEDPCCAAPGLAKPEPTLPCPAGRGAGRFRLAGATLRRGGPQVVPDPLQAGWHGNRVLSTTKCYSNVENARSLPMDIKLRTCAPPTCQLCQQACVLTVLRVLGEPQRQCKALSSNNRLNAMDVLCGVCYLRITCRTPVVRHHMTTQLPRGRESSCSSSSPGGRERVARSQAHHV